MCIPPSKSFTPNWVFALFIIFLASDKDGRLTKSVQFLNIISIVSLLLSFSSLFHFWQLKWPFPFPVKFCHVLVLFSLFYYYTVFIFRHMALECCVWHFFPEYRYLVDTWRLLTPYSLVAFKFHLMPAFPQWWVQYSIPYDWAWSWRRHLYLTRLCVVLGSCSLALCSCNRRFFRINLKIYFLLNIYLL